MPNALAVYDNALRVMYGLKPHKRVRLPLRKEDLGTVEIGQPYGAGGWIVVVINRADLWVEVEAPE